MPIRASRPWTGATPLFGMPHTASAGAGMCTSIPTLAWGRSRSINPVREGQIGMPGHARPDASARTVAPA